MKLHPPLKLNRLGLALATVVLAAPTSGAFAQGGDRGLEEIVVTAQNREESVQDVPIKMDVIGAEEFKKAGVRNFRDVERLAPTLGITNDNTAVQITLRGVGTNSTDEAQDTSIVVNIDGEYINRPSVLNTSLFDMERVEVLRGPQGTLEGRNSTGGAINFITRKPGEAFGSNAQVTVGNFGALGFEGGIDMPLGDTSAIRVAGIYQEHDGYFTSPNNQDTEHGSDEVTGARVSFRADPNDAFSFNLAAEFVDREAVPANQAFANLNAPGVGPTGADCSGGVGSYTPIGQGLTDDMGNPVTLCLPTGTNFQDSINRSNYDGAVFSPGFLEQDSTALRTRASYDFGGFTATYTGGYRETSRSGRLGLPVIFQSFIHKEDVDTQSHELLFNGEAGENVLWQAGVFYFNEQIDSADGFHLPPFVIPPNGVYLTYFTRDVESESLSLFGQVDFQINEKLAAVLGLRYTDNDRSAVYGDFPFLPLPAGAVPTAADLNPIFLQNLGSEESETTWLAGLNYHPDDDTLLFGKVSSGLKGGGFDSVGTYDPETNTAFEVGMKKNIGNNIFNVGAFYYDYEDLQVSVLLDTSVGGQVFNAGAATIWGIESDAVFQVSDNGTLTASVNYLNAEYDELFTEFAAFCVGGCGLTGAGVDIDPGTPGVQQPNLAGNTPPRSPEWVLALGYDHYFDLNDKGTLVASIHSKYKSSYFLDIFNYSDSEQDGYSQTDISLEYRAPGDKWYVRAYVRNLEDEQPLTFAGYIAAGPDDIYNFQFAPPRTYGVTAGFDF